MFGLFKTPVTPAKAGAQPEQGVGCLELGTGLRRYDECEFGAD
jgi:hypothetical protein